MCTLWRGLRLVQWFMQLIHISRHVHCCLMGKKKQTNKKQFNILYCLWICRGISPLIPGTRVVKVNIQEIHTCDFNIWIVSRRVQRIFFLLFLLLLLLSKVHFNTLTRVRAHEHACTHERTFIYREGISVLDSKHRWKSLFLNEINFPFCFLRKWKKTFLYSYRNRGRGC